MIFVCVELRKVLGMVYRKTTTIELLDCRTCHRPRCSWEMSPGYHLHLVASASPWQCWNGRSGPGKPDRVWSLFISALPQAFLQHHHVLQIAMTAHGLFSNPAPACSWSEAMSPISSRFYTFSRRPSDGERLVAKTNSEQNLMRLSLLFPWRRTHADHQESRL